ncbi:MAG: type IV pilus modification PilV family protein [Planctomycetota bacterium]|jgi:type II secretory pathway pseudopilin PulG
MARTPEIRQRRHEGGFTYLEAICSVVVLAIALLGHAASTVTEHRLAEAGQVRSEALHASRQFVERLRADEDFTGLLSRILALQLTTGAGGKATLDDGRTAFDPTAYYPDFVVPDAVDSMAVRVEVPLHVGDVVSLREDQNLPYFGLPGDLNGDGAVDDQPRDDDYRALPVAFTFRWVPPGQAPAELRFSTWLRGRR